jgi:hypothetical protein
VSSGKILIIGANGSMGRRWGVILDWLRDRGERGCAWTGADVEHTPAEIRKKALMSSGVIIATPTPTHGNMILSVLNGIKAPILCEKPVTKDLKELELIKEVTEKNGTPFRMVNQYRMLADPKRIGPSFYNYFRHGNDGLYWDCLQVIGLARGDVRVDEDSPIWQCKINGKRIPFEAMDAAYVGYFQLWRREPKQPWSEIIPAHAKTAELERVHPWRK